MRAGNIRAYAVTDTKRVESAPDIPTTDEAGLPGFHMTLWSGHVGAEGHAEGNRGKAQRRGGRCAERSGRAQAAGKSGLADAAADQLTPEALGAWQKAEIAKWWPMIKAANVKVE